MSGGDLSGRAVLVTGGGRNIGRAIAAAAAGAGAAVAILEKDPGAGREAAEGIAAAGGRAVEVTADVRDRDAVDRAVAEAVDRLGRLDGLVNNAAVYVRKDFLFLEEEDWDLALDTNLKGPFLVLQSFARHARARGGGGAVVNLASVHGSVGDGTVVAHCAAKSGVLGLTRAAAEALRDAGIRVNAVSPGGVDTWKGPYDAPVPEAPIRSMLVPRMVAEAVVFLLSERAAGITGADLSVGGGTSVGLRVP